MHVLANWTAKLVQFLSVASFITQIVIVYIQVDLLFSLVDLSVHSSGPFGGPFSDWGGGGGGGSSEPREPPLATALDINLDFRAMLLINLIFEFCVVIVQAGCTPRAWLPSDLATSPLVCNLYITPSTLQKSRTIKVMIMTVNQCMWYTHDTCEFHHVTTLFLF